MEKSDLAADRHGKLGGGDSQFRWNVTFALLVVERFMQVEA